MNEKLAVYPSVQKPWLKYYSLKDIKEDLPEESIYDYLWKNCKDNPEHIMLSYMGSKISTKSFFQHVSVLINAFKNQGLQKGDVVTLISYITPETIYCVYALNFLGIIINCVSVKLEATEILENVKQTKSEMIIVIDSCLDKIDLIEKKLNGKKILILSFEESFPITRKILYKIHKSRKKTKNKSDFYITYKNFTKFESDVITEKCQTDKNDIALYEYTNEGTDKSKCVGLSNLNINQIHYQYKYAGIKYDKNDVFMTFVPLYNSLGLCLCMHMPLCSGITLDVFPFPKTELLVKHFTKVKPNHIVGDSYHIDRMISSLKNEASYLKTLAVSGNSLSIEKEIKINMKLESLGSNAQLLSGYGMTELAATSISEFSDIKKNGTIGIPLPFCNVKIIDPENNRELPYNEVGELLIRSPGQTTGYINNEKENSTLFFIDEKNRKWVKTGDLASIDRDGFVSFKGELKRIYIKNDSEGNPHKIFPQRVESSLLNNPKIKECAVIVDPDKKMLNKQIAFVSTFDSVDNINLESYLKNYLSKLLPDYMIPEYIFYITEIPRLQNGKIDYQKLQQDFGRL